MRTRNIRLALFAALAVVVAALPAGADGGTDLSELQTATAPFRNTANAESAGYVSTLNTLGCFENPGVGGMGLHYLNEELLLDGVVDETAPEALVYEMARDGSLRLVGVEYIMPAPPGSTPPELFGHTFHLNSALGVWVLHAWAWKHNPAGVFQDWNPNVGRCPDGVPVFGVDLP